MYLVLTYLSTILHMECLESVTLYDTIQNIQAHVLSTYILQYYITYGVLRTSYTTIQNIQAHVLSTYIPQYYITYGVLRISYTI